MIDSTLTPKKMQALKALGVSYSDESIANAAYEIQGKTEMTALIAYLQGLGTVLTQKR